MTKLRTRRTFCFVEFCKHTYTYRPVKENSATWVVNSVTLGDRLSLERSFKPRHSKSRSAPHCRVLPPGEYNGMLPELLAVYSEFNNDSCNRFTWMLLS